jgi:Gram-negative bacterial TonB protein C-terminal
LSVADAITAQGANASPVITRDVLEALRAEAFAALKSLPRRGAEIGGFLTTSEECEDDFRANGVEFVPCEHLYGPSYQLSPLDSEVFRQRVAFVCNNRGRKPLAYFRSCTREEVRVEPNDVSVVREVLPGAGFIVILKPFPNGNSTVRIFAADNLDLRSEFELGIGLATLPEPTEIEPPSSAAETTIESRPPSDSRRNASGMRFLAIGALAVIAAVGALFALRSRQPAPVPTSSGLGMRVETQANGFRVTWNRNISAFQKPTGVLRIDDGRQPRDLQLDQRQLADGSVIYISDAKDLTFRMQVRGEAGRQLTESVRLVVAGRPSDRAVPGEATDLVAPVINSWPSESPRPGSFRPAQPLRRFQPEIRFSSIGKPAIVQVKVRVDASGHVTEARQVNTVPSLPSSVSTQALEASRKWTFEPAKRRGHNVPSDYRIAYSFNPPDSERPGASLSHSQH